MLRSKTYTTMHVLLYDLVNKLSYLLNIRWWLLRYRYHKYAKTFGCWASGAQRTAWESAFELILTAKMETRHPIWSWLSAFAITAELRWPAGLKSQDYVPKIYVATPIDVVVLKCRKICSTRYWQNCALFTGQKKTKFWIPLKLSLLHGSHPKSARTRPQRLTHTIPDDIQIGSLSAEV